MMKLALKDFFAPVVWAVIASVLITLSGIVYWQTVTIAGMRVTIEVQQHQLTLKDQRIANLSKKPLFCAEHIVMEDTTQNMTFKNLRYIDDTWGPKFVNEDGSLVVWVSGPDTQLQTEGSYYDVEIYTWYHGYDCNFHFYNATAFVATPLK